jgi:hypothetical protein
MNMKDMIQRMTDIETGTKKQLNETCGDMPSAPMNQGTPVSINVSLNASGKEHVQDLINMMKNAGLGGAQEVSPAMMPMRLDIEKFRDTVDAPRGLAMGDDMDLPADHDSDHDIIKTLDRDNDGDHDMDDHDLEKSKEESYANEPDEKYDDHNTMVKDLSGGINGQKKMYKPAAKGDNPMAVESIKEKLYALLAEKKAKPDFLDIDGDGDQKEPMKKAVADKKKGAAPKKGVNPFAKKDEKVKEGFPTVADAKARADKEKTTGKFDKKELKPGVTQYTRKSSTYDDGGKDSDQKKAEKKGKK